MKEKTQKTAQSKKEYRPKVRQFNFDFMSMAKLFATLSIIGTIGSLALIFTKGLNYGIDFAGGTEVQIQFNKPVDPARVRKFAEDMDLKNVTVQSFADGQEYSLRWGTVEGKTDKETNELLQSTIRTLTENVNKEFANEGATIRGVDTVGPQVGEELKRNGILAAFYCLLIILIYVSVRFDYSYAPGAVFCLFHDVVLTLGIFSLTGHEVNVQTMAALLTLIGYSLNDTIVSFDRMRENMGIYRDKSLSWIINRSINDTLSRTLLTATTTFLAVIVMYFMAGGVIAELSFPLAIGIVIGCYSSIYVAAPLIMVVERLQKKQSAA